MADKFIGCEVTGLDQLRAALMDKAPKEARSVLRKALRAGARIFQEAVVREAPRKTGFLSSHFRIRTSIRGDNASAYVVPDRKAKYPTDSKTPGKKGRSRDAAEIARFQEFGTQHQAADPFMTRAFEVSKASVLDRVIQTLRELLH